MFALSALTCLFLVLPETKSRDDIREDIREEIGDGTIEYAMSSDLRSSSSLFRSSSIQAFGVGA